MCVKEAKKKGEHKVIKVHIVAIAQNACTLVIITLNYIIIIIIIIILCEIHKHTHTCIHGPTYSSTFMKGAHKSCDEK